MKEGLSIDAAFKGTQDNTREDGLLGRLSQALADANIAGGYTRLQEPTPLRDGLYIVHGSKRQRANFYITCKPGDYEIKSCDLTNVQFDSQGYQTSHKTPMEPAQIEAVVGKTSDYNTFIGAIGFILAHHYPSAVQNGSLQKVMDKFVRPDGAQPAASPHGRQHEEKLLSRGVHIGNIPGSIDL